MDARSNIALHLVVLSSFCFLLFFAQLGKSPFFNKGEPREGLVVQNIFHQGNWLFPLRAGGEIPSKPPLFHWFGAIASAGLGGVTEFTVRFPSALFASLGIFSVYGLGRRLFNPETALWGGIILATSLGYQHVAVSARVDMTLTFFLTLSLVLFYCLYHNTLERRLWYILFYLILGVGVLAKGPVSLILAGMVMLSFLGVNKRWDFLRRLLCDWAVLLMILIPLFWYGMATVKGGEEFFSRQIIHENIARFFLSGEGGTGHQKPFYYYFPYLFSQGLPWSLFLPFVLVSWFKNRRFSDEGYLFLILWVLIIFVSFSLSAGKRSPYIIPLYPSLSLLTASWFLSTEGSSRHEKIGFRLIGLGSLMVAMFLLASVLGILWGNDLAWFITLFAPALKEKDQANLLIVKQIMAQEGGLLLFLAVLCSVLWLSLSRSLWLLRLRPVLPLLAILSLLSGLFAHNTLTPSFAEAKSYAPFMEQVNQLTQDRRLFLVRGDFDPGLLYFYGKAEMVTLDRAPKEMGEVLASAKAYFILSEEDWKTLSQIVPASPKPILRSVGRGPDGNARLVLVQGQNRG